MGASVIKRAAAEELSSQLSAAIPDLAGKIVISQQPPDKAHRYPCLAIIPRGFKTEFFQEYEVDTTVDGTVVFSVGEVMGTFELRLATQHEFDRERLEDLIDHTFYSRRGSPGVLVGNIPTVCINDTVSTYTASVAFEYGDVTWEDEFVFSNKYWRFLDVNCVFPALIVRSGTDKEKIIDHLILGLTEDLTSNVADESVEVLVDGSITQPTV